MPEIIPTAYTRANLETPVPERRLTPWIVQNILYELVVTHMAKHSPESEGYPIPQAYSPEHPKTGIFVDIAFHWNPNNIQQRPAVFIFREDASYINPVMGGTIGSDPRESEHLMLSLVKMNLGIACIATNVASTEMLADYVRSPLLQFCQQIQCDFGLRQFRMTVVSRPQIYSEAKDHFIITTQVATVFDENWIVKRDDLKIKTFSLEIYDKIDGTKFS